MEGKFIEITKAWDHKKAMVNADDISWFIEPSEMTVKRYPDAKAVLVIRAQEDTTIEVEESYEEIVALLEAAGCTVVAGKVDTYGGMLGQPLRIRFERKKNGWTLRELSRRTGIKTPDLSRLERGLMPPYPTWRKRLAREFNLPTDILFAPEDEKEASPHA